MHFSCFMNNADDQHITDESSDVKWNGSQEKSKV